jgi:hypothetical protein
MISYTWISEQSFLNPSLFILLIVFAYRPRRLHLFLLAAIQILVYSFSLVNWGPFIFEPLAQRFFPQLLPIILSINPSKSSLIWHVRGTIGLIISLFLGVFLLTLLKPGILAKGLKRIRDKLGARQTFEYSKVIKKEVQNFFSSLFKTPNNVVSELGFDYFRDFSFLEGKGGVFEFLHHLSPTKESEVSTPFLGGA